MSLILLRKIQTSLWLCVTDVNPEEKKAWNNRHNLQSAFKGWTDIDLFDIILSKDRAQP